MVIKYVLDDITISISGLIEALDAAKRIFPGFQLFKKGCVDSLAVAWGDIGEDTFILACSQSPSPMG